MSVMLAEHSLFLIAAAAPDSEGEAASFDNRK
jgi:hypothetical protein